MSRDKQFTADHGESFYADAVTIMHGQGKIVLDFKTTVPRFDQTEDDAQHTLVTEHSPVALTPQTAKMLYNLLEDNIEDYEETFGEIELPEQDGGDETAAEDTTGYIG
ncbi:MAG: DUF3467 domain-containing protein [Candidatus Nanohaloarchaea archaeon]|nr:DUF3467 domain-containing protein [Candidatus Nanohaloarchaea archaeon]